MLLWVSGFLYAAPYAMLPIPAEGEEIPDSRPNKGSVKNRNHQKRMAQRAEFAKVSWLHWRIDFRTLCFLFHCEMSSLSQQIILNVVLIPDGFSDTDAGTGSEGAEESSHHCP